MSSAILIKSGGGGLTSDDVTATTSEVLEGKTALTSDSGDEPATGTMLSDATITNGNQLLNGISAYGRHGVKVNGAIQTISGQTITPSTSQQRISCSGKRLSSDVVINAIPAQYINVGGSGATYGVFNNGSFTSGWSFVSKYWDAETKAYNGDIQWETITDDNGVSRRGVKTTTGTVYQNGSYTPTPSKKVLVINRGIDLGQFKTVRLYWYTNYTYSYNRDTKYMYAINTSNKGITATKQRTYYDPDNIYKRFTTVDFSITDWSGVYFLGFSSATYSTCLAQIQLIRN